MRKITLVALVFGALLASCSDSGKKVEASEAETVETVETETFNSLANCFKVIIFLID